MANNRYPNMSYCMFENTRAAVDQLIEHMAEAQEEGTVREFISDMSQSERRYMSELFDQCQQFQQLANEIWEQADLEGVDAATDGAVDL